MHYFADGYSLSDPASHNRQANWVCMFNPMKKPAKLKFTFYYEDDEPTHMDSLRGRDWLHCIGGFRFLAAIFATTF